MRLPTRRAFAPASILLFRIATAAAHAADGDLDDGFFGDGKVVLGGAGAFGVTAIIAAPDERLVVVATHDPGDGFWEWYWRAVGDSSATPGCYVSPPGEGSIGRASAAAFDSAGRLLVAGWGGYLGSGAIAVARFSYPDCVLDTSFSGDGWWELEFPAGYAGVTAIAVDAVSGRIALGGYHVDGTATALVIVQLSDSGVPVGTFSGDGWLALELATGPEVDDFVGGIAFDEDGRTIVAVTAYSQPGIQDRKWCALRFTAGGESDGAFGTEGMKWVAFDLGPTTALEDRLFGLARDPNDGKLLLVGEAETETGSALAIARLLPGGALDSTFSGNGKAHLAFGDAHARLEGVAVDGLGRVLAAGFLDYPSGDADFIAMRFSADGAPDPSFGFGGLSLIALDFGPADHQDDFGRAMALPAGRVVVAGDVEATADSESLPGLARLDVALVFADGFESGGISPWSTAAGVL